MPSFAAGQTNRPFSSRLKSCHWNAVASGARTDGATAGNSERRWRRRPLLAPLPLGPMARQWLTHQMILIRSPCRPRKHEHVAAERIGLRRLLGLRSQRGKAFAHVRHSLDRRQWARTDGVSAGNSSDQWRKWSRLARPALSSEPESSRQATDQPGQRLGIIDPADTKPMPTSYIDLKQAIGIG